MARNDINSNFYQIASVDANDNVVGISTPASGLKITGGTVGQVLTATATDGALSWATPSASSTPNFGAYMSANQAIPANAWTVVTFDTVSYNNGSAYNATTSKFTAPVAGLYQFEFNLPQFTGGTTNLGTTYVSVWKNNALHRLTNSFTLAAGASYTGGGSNNVVTLRLAAGDIIDWRAFVGSAGWSIFSGGSTGGNNCPWFVGRYISA